MDACIGKRVHADTEAENDISFTSGSGDMLIIVNLFYTTFSLCKPGRH
jgi:hypothetical protein